MEHKRLWPQNAALPTHNRNLLASQRSASAKLVRSLERSSSASVMTSEPGCCEHGRIFGYCSRSRPASRITQRGSAKWVEWGQMPLKRTRGAKAAWSSPTTATPLANGAPKRLGYRAVGTDPACSAKSNSLLTRSNHIKCRRSVVSVQTPTRRRLRQCPRCFGLGLRIGRLLDR